MWRTPIRAWQLWPGARVNRLTRRHAAGVSERAAVAYERPSTRAPADPRFTLMAIPTWSHVMLHHSLTRDSQTVSWGAIRRYHIDPDGPYRMRDIGYHFGVEQIGDTFEVLLGRSLRRPGAHCREAHMNQRALGICLVGNFDAELPPWDQWYAAVELVQTLLWLLDLTPGAVVAHRDFAPYKSCPGARFDLGAFRDAIRSEPQRWRTSSTNSSPPRS